MKIIKILIITVCIPSIVYTQNIKVLKKKAIQYIDKNQQEFSALSQQIWSYAEPSYHEYQSSSLLIEKFESEGFEVEKRVGGLPTMFVASYGNSGPVIGLFGEYDADPGASNDTVPRRSAIDSNSYGHGAGHNLLGVGSLAAALAIKKLVEQDKLNCIIKFFGSTDEGGRGGRTIMVRNGYFDDLDISIYWHPSPVNSASAKNSWDAMALMNITLIGEKRRSMIQPFESVGNSNWALEMLLDKIHEIRQSNEESTRFMYSLNTNNKDLKHLPDTISMQLRVHHAEQAGLLNTISKLRESCTQIQSITKVNIDTKILEAHHGFIANSTAMEVIHKNMKSLNEIRYSEQELQYGYDLQKYLGKAQKDPISGVLPFQKSDDFNIYGYSSDIGEASWHAPEVYFVTTCLPPGIPMHDWPGSVFSGHSVGTKGMIYASKVISLFIIDYLASETLQLEIRSEFVRKTKDYQYKPIVED